MSPQRLLTDPQATEFERDLLSSWNDEQPNDDGKKKLLIGLGLATTASAAGAGILSGRGASIAPKAVLGGLTLAKWLMLAAITATGVVGLMMVLSRGAPTRATEVPPLPTSDLPASDLHGAAIAKAQEMPAPIPAPAISIAPKTQVRVALDPAAKNNTPLKQPISASETSNSLAEEVAALDSARAALLIDPARARDLAADYEARYPNGSFKQEAEVLRIEAMSKTGDADGASRAAAQFLNTYPKSPHAARVQKLLTP